MTWKTLTDLLAREFRNIRRLPVVNFGFAQQPVTDPHDLESEELLWASRVDQIIRDYSRTRRWPALDEKERFFIRERIRFGYEYAAISEISIRDPLLFAKKRKRGKIVNPQRLILEWLLIDVWRESGVVNWLEPFFIMASSTREPETLTELQISE